MPTMAKDASPGDLEGRVDQPHRGFPHFTRGEFLLAAGILTAGVAFFGIRNLLQRNTSTPPPPAATAFPALPTATYNSPTPTSVPSATATAVPQYVPPRTFEQAKATFQEMVDYKGPFPVPDDLVSRFMAANESAFYYVTGVPFRDLHNLTQAILPERVYIERVSAQGSDPNSQATVLEGKDADTLVFRASSNGTIVVPPAITFLGFTREPYQRLFDKWFYDDIRRKGIAPVTVSGYSLEQWNIRREAAMWEGTVATLKAFGLYDTLTVDPKRVNHSLDGIIARGNIADKGYLDFLGQSDHFHGPELLNGAELTPAELIGMMRATASLEGFGIGPFPVNQVRTFGYALATAKAGKPLLKVLTGFYPGMVNP